MLVILGIILLVLALVLFAPVKYSGKGSKYGEELKIQALVTYLNPIVRVKVQYPDEEIVQVKICGFTVFSTGKEDATDSKENIVKEDNDEKQKEKEEPSFESNPDTEQECKHQGSEESGKQSLDSKVEENHEEHDASKNSVLDTVGYYASLFQENKGLILNVIKTVLKALKTILPRKCRIKAVFGTGEADTIGFIYAAYCALDGYLPGEIVFEPVWTEKFAEGEFLLKGKIRLIHFLVAVIKIIANKNVRLLIKKIRRV